MNKYQKLKKYLEELSKYLDIIVVHNESTKKYLEIYKDYVDELIEVVDDKTIEASDGALLGLLRGISDYDELCSDEKLRKLAKRADSYYGNECKDL